MGVMLSCKHWIYEIYFLLFIQEFLENAILKAFFYYPRNHTYGEIIYWLTILGSIFLIDKYASMNEVLKEVLHKYKKNAVGYYRSRTLYYRISNEYGKGQGERAGSGRSF